MVFADPDPAFASRVEVFPYDSDVAFLVWSNGTRPAQYLLIDGEPIFLPSVGWTCQRRSISELRKEITWYPT